MKILFTFVGTHDPFGLEAVDGPIELGPALAVINDQQPDLVCFIESQGPRLEKHNEETIKECKTRFPECKIERIPFLVKDPTNHLGILNQLREICKGVSSKYPDATFGMSLTSGTPSMHACMLLLAASGEIDAHVFQSLDPRYVKEGERRVREVDFSNSSFPTIQPFKSLDYEEEEDWAGIAEEVGIVGKDNRLHQELSRAAQIAKYPQAVLITGENGTGKDLFARFVHKCSQRPEKPLIAFNAGGLAENIVESQLFGHKKGAFTGATSDHKGYFKEADGGTIFIDEIGEIPISTQVKLLRTLENRTIMPLGGQSREQKVDVRIIAATNIDLNKAIHEGKFREDLRHRFPTIIKIPPLRERPRDLPVLARSFLDDFNRQNSISGEERRLSKDALKKLAGYHWPGNIRELKNTIENAAIFSKGKVITEREITFDESMGGKGLEGLPAPVEGFVMPDYIRDIRRHLIKRAVELEGGCITGSTIEGCMQVNVAKRLGFKPQALTQAMNSGLFDQ